MTGGGVKGVGRADAWATLTACGQGICSQSAPSRPPPQAPSLILSCLPLPRKSPPLPGEASPPPAPAPQAEALERALAEIRKVWKTLADFFSLQETPSLPHPLGPLRFLCLGSGREGLSWGKVKAWLRSSPAECEGRRVRNQTGAGAVRKKEFCPSCFSRPRAGQSSVSRFSFLRCP